MSERMLMTVIYPNEDGPNYLRLMEQTEYLYGVLWSDPELRLDKTLDADKEIDPYGTGTKAFWRGVLESAGTVGLYGAAGGRAYPRVQLNASHSMLKKFLAFLQEEIHTRQGVAWAWDDNGKLAFQALGGFLRITGQKAQDVVRVLYVDTTVSRESCRFTADRILAWTPRR